MSNAIHLTRGDTARYVVDITNDIDGSDYAMQTGDTLCLTVKRSTRDRRAILQKNLTGDNAFLFTPQDTNGLEFGRYVYDVQLTTSAGEVYTVIRPSVFEVMDEVTWSD